MSAAGRTHILFDFFGTLVDYSASGTEQDYHGSYEILREFGADLSYDDFLAVWSDSCAPFDQRSAVDDSEYSMHEVATAFLARVLARAPSQAETTTFVTRFVDEWNVGVHYPAGIGELVDGLADRYQLAVVSNTHQPELVPDHLRAMRIADKFRAVVTSIELGWRKPHPAIYAAALNRLGIHASDVVFVGDSYGPDFEGPERAGMQAFLIDPTRSSGVPEGRRLDSIFDLPERVAAG